jgi:hypothetical protein
MRHFEDLDHGSLGEHWVLANFPRKEYICLLRGTARHLNCRLPNEANVHAPGCLKITITVS